MDAKILQGRTLPTLAVGPGRRGVNYKVGSLAELLGYRNEKIKGKGIACGVPLVRTYHDHLVGARVIVGNTHRGRHMKLEKMEPSIIAGLVRVGLEVV